MRNKIETGGNMPLASVNVEGGVANVIGAGRRRVSDICSGLVLIVAAKNNTKLAW